VNKRPTALCEPFEFGDDPTALYRLYDAEDVLLYVGITAAPAPRMERHADRQAWWPEVARKTMTWYSTRLEAATAEVAAIEAEKPRYNKKTTLANTRIGAKRPTIDDLIVAYETGDWIHLGPHSFRTMERAKVG
jgi:hypothetical protein